MELTAVHFVAAATVVAAFIAALMSLVTLVNSKEQKTTEFRQAWINALRTEVARFQAQARYIATAIHTAKRFDPNCFSRDSKAYEIYADNRRELANAYYLISLHFKPDDASFDELRDLLNKVLSDLRHPGKVTFEQIDASLALMTAKVRNLLKEEWERVKAGEAPYKWTKRAATSLLTILFIIILVAGFGAYQGWSVFAKLTTPINFQLRVLPLPPNNKAAIDQGELPKDGLREKKESGKKD